MQLTRHEAKTFSRWERHAIEAGTCEAAPESHVESNQRMRKAIALTLLDESLPRQHRKRLERAIASTQTQNPRSTHGS